MNRLAPARLIHRLRHIRIENKGLKALSLLLAILLFAVSRQPVTDIRIVGVPIEYRDLTPGVEIGAGADQTVSVRLSGPRNTVRSLSPNQVLVVADLSGKQPGERTIQLSADDAFLPDNVKIRQVEPASIRVKLEPTVTRRVKVEAQVSGRVAQGREIYRISLNPDVIEIEGPQSLVNKIDRLRTETVNLDGRAESFQTPVGVDTPQYSLRIKDQGPVNLIVEIGEQRIFRRLDNVTVRWPDKNPRERLLTKSVAVDVYGQKSAVDELSPDDLIVEVKTNGLPTDVTNLDPKIQLPAHLEKSIEVRNIIPKVVKVKR